VGALTVVQNVISGGESVARLQSKIEAEKTRAAEACNEIERLNASKLDAENYEAVEVIDRRIAKQRWIIAHAEKLLPELEARLAAAKAEALKKAIARLLIDRRALYLRLRAAIEVATEIQHECMRHDQAACAEIGENAARVHLPVIAFRGILLADLVKIWTNEQDRVFAVNQRAITVARQQTPSKPRPSRHFPSANAPLEQAPVPRMARERKALPEIENGVRVIVLRSGIEINGERLVAGDVTIMGADQAEAAMRAGSVDLAPAEQKHA
jgi:hypothetical protein